MGIVKRFARESVYLPKRNLILFGYHLGRTNHLPVYDISMNRWGTVEVPGSDFFTHRSEGVSVDLGLIYDAKRGLVWAVMCKMSEVGHLQVLRVDESLMFSPLDSALAK